MKHLLLLTSMAFIFGCKTPQSPQYPNLDIASEKPHIFSEKDKTIQQIADENRCDVARMKEIESVISDSDDYNKHREFFLIKSLQLLDEDRITISGLKEWGGWWRSPQNKGKYFTYKNADVSTNADKVYIDPRNPEYQARGRTRWDEEAEERAFKEFLELKKMGL